MRIHTAISTALDDMGGRLACRGWVALLLGVMVGCSPQIDDGAGTGGGGDGGTGGIGGTGGDGGTGGTGGDGGIGGIGGTGGDGGIGGTGGDGGIGGIGGTGGDGGIGGIGGTGGDGGIGGIGGTGGSGGSGGSPASSWARQFSGVQITALAVDALDNTIIAGSFTTYIDAGDSPLAPEGAYPMDAFVAKLDPSGNPVFAKKFYGYDRAAYDIATDASGNIALLGIWTEEVDFGGPHIGGGDPRATFYYVVKLDPMGGFLWHHNLVRESVPTGAGPKLLAEALAMDGAGNVLVGGSAYGGEHPSPYGVWDAFITKFDGATGALSWNELFGGYGDDTVHDIDTRGTEIVVLGMIPYIEEYDGFSESCAALSTFSPAGDETTRYCVEPGDWVMSGQIAIDGAGDVITGHSIADVDDYAISMLHADGSSLWSRLISPVQGPRIAADALGNVFLAGTFTGALDLGGSELTAAGGSDVYLAKLAPGGDLLFSASHGDAGEQRLGHLAVSATGAAVIAGDFAGALTFGDSTLVAETAQDAFLARVGF